MHMQKSKASVQLVQQMDRDDCITSHANTVSSEEKINTKTELVSLEETVVVRSPWSQPWERK